MIMMTYTAALQLLCHLYDLTEHQASRVLAYAIEHDQLSFTWDDIRMDFLLRINPKCLLFEDAQA